MKHLKTFKIFESSEEPDINNDWGYDNNLYPSPTNKYFLIEYLTKEFGKPYTGGTNADWGGMTVWLIDETNQLYVGIDDEYEVFYIKRKDDGNQTSQDDLGSATNIKELEELVSEIKKG
jgi:hypothetical protein